MGAIWDKKSSSFKIRRDELPYDIRTAISSSEIHFKEKMAKIDKRLSQILPAEIADNIKTEELFDAALWKVETDLQKTLENITVPAQLTPARLKKISKEWQNNMDLWIKDFTEEHIKELRLQVMKSTFSGNRYESLIATIKKSYDVTERKAKFLARQETNLLLAKYKESRYVDSGIKEYRWTCVHNPKDKSPKQHTPGNVRYSHGILDGKIFRFDNPPVTTAPGEPQRRNNPSEDYNCLPGNAFVSFYGSINKAFRRRYTGELTELITDNGIIFNTTANHPILTNRGWIAAQDINVGDYVFASQEESLFTKEMNRKNMKPTAEDIFNALSFCSKIRSKSLSESDFHNDIGVDKEVDIIDVNRELLFNTIIEAHQELSHFIFERPDSSFSGFSPVNRFLHKLHTGSISSSFMSLLGELEFILFTHFPHADEICFRTRTSLNIGFDQPFCDTSPTNPIFFRDGELTHPILIIINNFLIEGNSIVMDDFLSSNLNSNFSQSFAQNIRIHADNLANLVKSEIPSFIKPFRIVDKIIRGFSGHVYNFETMLNWFTSENIILHNCRCYAIPIVRE